MSFFFAIAAPIRFYATAELIVFVTYREIAWLSEPSFVCFSATAGACRKWYEVKQFGDGLRMDGMPPPTAELASVEECSQPECSIALRFATMRLVRVERCSQGVFKGTSPHGGELRGGVGRRWVACW